MGAKRVKKPVYVDTNFGTRVVVLASDDCSTKRFRKKFLRVHRSCYPNYGKLKVQSLQVKHKSEFTGKECYYNLSGTISIGNALGGEGRCLHIEASKSALTQTEVMKFFGIKNFMEPMEKLALAKDSRKRWRLLFSEKKKTGRLLPYKPIKDESERLKQMKSLAKAMMALNISYSPELTYVSGTAPRSANEPKFENGGMQVLRKEDKKTLNYVHAMGKAGVLPPLMVVRDIHEGYTVKACGPIKDWTLVAEYVGDVDYLTNREYDPCDSLMTLLSAKDPAQSLLICPDKRANIARFISGINNHKPDSKKKLNLKCVRYNVDGECRALLVAIRDIAKGERLYYDYNGLENEYPTQNFV